MSAMGANTRLLKKSIFMVAFVRNLSINEVSKNMELISDEKIAKDDNGKLVVPEDKPLVVTLTWLLARRKVVLKYSQLYLDQGFHVLNVGVNPWQLLWPVKGSQRVASDLLEFLSTNYTRAPLLLHGFSVGGYLWGEALVHVMNDRKKYEPICDRVVGQIWDSAADITEIPIGLPYAVFPKNAVMQAALRKYILYHMKAFHKVATSHYIRSSQMFHSNLVRAPALFFLSKSDPIGAFNSNMRVREAWEANGVPIVWKCWDRSPHVGHFRFHTEEYKQELFTFMDSLSMVAHPEKVKMYMRQ